MGSNQTSLGTIKEAQMTFPDALKMLAEIESEKFRFHGSEMRVFSWGEPGWAIEVEYLTQDDIDDILALVGWEYSVYRSQSYPSVWRITTNSINDSPSKRHHWCYEFSTKLDAARAALAAVVEELIKRND
jgi:hypothetical protein